MLLSIIVIIGGVISHNYINYTSSKSWQEFDDHYTTLETIKDYYEEGQFSMEEKVISDYLTDKLGVAYHGTN